MRRVEGEDMKLTAHDEWFDDELERSLKEAMSRQNREFAEKMAALVLGRQVLIRAPAEFKIHDTNQDAGLAGLRMTDRSKA